MNVLQEMVFIGEIALQSKIAQRAAERLDASYTNFDHIELSCSIQSILVAAGNVSKILWPNVKYKTRGERLRQMLKVENGSILCSRKFRNHFEHYDERIDEWFKDNSSAVYTDSAMNPSLRSGLPPTDHRGYNSFNNTLVFRGETLELGKLLKALDEILSNCSQFVLV
jgi:hypothetical protein